MLDIETPFKEGTTILAGFNKWEDEYPAIILPLRPGDSADGLDDLPHRVVGGNDLQFHFLDKARHVFSAAIDHGMTLLAAVAEKGALHEIIDPYCFQGGSDLIQFDRLYDGFYKFHDFPPFWLRKTPLLDEEAGLLMDHLPE
jgi:hypothetical protein